MAGGFLTIAALQSKPARMDKSSWNDLSISLVRTVSLGEPKAAAAVAWIAMIQELGHDDVKPEQVLAWGELITQLDPLFYAAYFYVGVFCYVDEANSARVDDMLARGQGLFPDDYELPVLRAFAAHFGTGDLKRAAAHYRVAGAKPQAPAYVSALAQRLENDNNSCSALYEFASRQDSAMKSVLLTGCIKRQIELAATAYRLRVGGTPDLPTLLETGLLAPFPRLAGICWALHGPVAVAEPCP